MADSGVAIKFEPTFLAQHEEALYAAGYQRSRNQTFRGRSRSRGPRGGRGGSGSGSRQRERERGDSAKRRYDDGDTSKRCDDSSNSADESSKTGKTRKMNPIGSNGQGPAKVVFQDGKVVFVRHGGIFVRVSPNHLIKDKNEFGNQPENENETKSLNKNENNKHDNNNKPNTNFETIAIDDEDESIAVSAGENTELNQLNDITEPAVTTEGKHLPKKGEIIRLKKEDASEEEFRVVSRGGKAGGKYNDWYNIINDKTGEAQCVDLGAQDSWSPVERDEEVNVVLVPRDEHSKEDCMRAKDDELQKLKEFDSYEIVDDFGQFRISSI